MRIVVFGVGAVGGALAAGFARSGVDVIGIARGAQLDAIRANGLEVRTPAETFRAHFSCVAAPDEITFGADDVILLTMKTQDTAAALADLRAMGVRDQPIFCFQNGVANERLALRLFDNVHGATVMMPATYITPGEVQVHAEPRLGLFDLGAYPSGQTPDDMRLAEALDASGFGGFPMDRVMESKYGKLLMNLANVIEAALGPDAEATDLKARVRAEAERVLEASGIIWRDVGKADPRRRDLMRLTPIPGLERQGGSTTQSLRRSTGRVETDYLNGEIAYLGRAQGVPAPLNAALTTLGARLAREGRVPGSMSLDDLHAYLGL